MNPPRKTECRTCARYAEKPCSPDATVRVVGEQTINDEMVSRGDLKQGAVTPDQVILPANIGGLNDAK